MTRYLRPARFLASVRNATEARICVAAGADVIDCKDPVSGALGALAPREVAAVRTAVPAHVPVSATIGDVTDPREAAERASAMIAAGADLVKAGLYPDAEQAEMLACLGALRRAGARLVGVLFADRSLDFAVLGDMARAGFSGAMLDTADKTAGALTEVMPLERLEEFISAARAQRLFVGLAGALRIAHIPSLLALGPDVLGFRGALCREGVRGAAVDAHAVAAVRGAIPRLVAAPELGAMEHAS